jgi:hypothetical protein
MTQGAYYEEWASKNFPEYRQAHGNDPVFQDITQWEGKDWWRAIAEPTSLRYIVRKATLAALIGNYDKYLSMHGLAFDPDKPNQDALNYAALYARRAIASPELPHMFLAYNSGDVLTRNLSWNRFLTQFQNFKLDRWSFTSHDLWRAAQEGRKAEAVNGLFWTLTGDLLETGIRHGVKGFLTALFGGVAATAMDDDSRKFWHEFYMKLLEKPPFVPDLINVGVYGHSPTTVLSLGEDAAVKAFKAGKGYMLADNKKALSSMTDSLFDLAQLAGIPGGSMIAQVMRMVMSDGSIRYPYYDERTRLNNVFKNGNATEDEMGRRALLNHNFSRFEKMNHAYKEAMKRGDRQAAADILGAMKSIADAGKAQ